MLWIWLSGVVVTLAVVITLIIMFWEEMGGDDIDSDSIGGLLVGTVFVSLLWGISIVVATFIFTALYLKKKYRVPVTEWYEKTFKDDEN